MIEPSAHEFGAYPPRVQSSEPPNAHQLAVAEACDGNTYANVGRRFGITGHRVSMIKERVAEYRRWLDDCETEARRPRGERRVEFTTMSTRTRNAFRRANVVTVGQLAALSTAEMMDMEGAGKVSVAEVQAYLLARD